VELSTGREEPNMKTLSDYLAPGLDIIFVGINPGSYSAQAGHYFAGPRSRFWPAINRSGLLTEPLGSDTDHSAPEQGIGFTDVVKRPSSSASTLRTPDYRQGAPALKLKLERYEPLVVCFQGKTAYRNYLRYAEGEDFSMELGLQPRSIGVSKVFVVPNPSPANAAYSLDTLVSWYQRLKGLRDELR
jgi:TDG/mug DNA glycosylase family protein